MLTDSMSRAPLLILSATLASAYDFGGLKKQGPLSDFANVVPPSATARVTTAVPRGLALVTVISLRGEPVRSVARTIRTSWNEDVVVLLSLSERRMVVDSREDVVIDEQLILDRASASLAATPPDFAGALAEAANSVREQRGGVAAPATSAAPLRRIVWLVPLVALGWLGVRRERKASGWSTGGFGRV